MFDAWNICPVGEVASPVTHALVGGPFGSHLVSADDGETCLVARLNEQFAEADTAGAGHS